MTSAPRHANHERSGAGEDAGSVPDDPLGLWGELEQARYDLARARRELEQTRSERNHTLVQMREANERLVIASVQADELAERAEVGRQRAEALAARLAASEAAARLGEDQFRTIANAMPMLTWYADCDGHIAWFNDRWFEYTGTTSEATTGHEWESAHDPEDLPRVLTGWRAALASGEPWEDTFRLRRHDGELRWFLGRALPLRDAGGRTVRWLSTSMDIDEQKRSEGRARVAAMLEVAQRERARTNGTRLELLKRLESAQEEERRRVARDLHDQVGQTLTAISLSLEALRLKSTSSTPIAPELAQAQSLLAQLGREIHAVAVRLRPTALDDLGLSIALTQLVTHWAAQTNLQIDIEVGGLGPRLHSDVETALYRVVQEALTNMARYAGASRASVVLSSHDGQLSAVVEDNGRGFEPARVAHGRLGILGMHERVAQLGGTLEIESKLGGGTTVFARVPFRAR